MDHPIVHLPIGETDLSKSDFASKYRDDWFQSIFWDRQFRFLAMPKRVFATRYFALRDFALREDSSDGGHACGFRQVSKPDHEPCFHDPRTRRGGGTCPHGPSDYKQLVPKCFKQQGVKHKRLGR